MKARVITLANNKGGVTKTTDTINLGYGLARKGRTVLIIDVDAQSNTTWAITHKILKGYKNTIYDAITQKRPLHELIRPTTEPNLFIVRSSLWMNFAEVQLFQEDYRERRLRNALRPYLNKFDYILIDTPPNLGVITVNAIMACTDILIPITLNEFSLVGISILLNTIKRLKKSADDNEIDAKLPILGVAVSQARDTKDASEHERAIYNYFGDLVLEPFIPLNVRVEQANNPKNEGSLFDLYPESTGAKAYVRLVESIETRMEETRLHPEAYHKKTDDLLANISDEFDEDEEED